MHGEQLQGAATMAHHPTQDTGGAGGCPSSHCPGTGSKEQGLPRTAGHVAPWSLALTQSTLAFPWRQSPSSFQQEDLRIKDQRGRLAWGRELAPGHVGEGSASRQGPSLPSQLGMFLLVSAPGPQLLTHGTPLPRTEMDLSVAKGGNGALLRKRRP